MDPRPEGASLLYAGLQDRPSLLQRQSTSQGNMGDSEPPDILYETCACIIHTINLQLHMSIIIETLHDQPFSLTSEDSLRDSKPRVPEDQGTGMTSQCMKLVCLCHSH